MSDRAKYIFFLLLALTVIGTIIVVLVLMVQSGNVAILNPKGAIALYERDLFLGTIFLMLIVVIPVFILIISFTWIFRATNLAAKYTPEAEGSLILEIVWWVPPCVIILILGLITWKSTHELDPYAPLAETTPPITIQVVALNWKWLFIYPNERIATVNFVQFPEKTPVNFQITADAPMNSFWIPQLGGQIYAMAGMMTKLHLIADGVGDYAGLSANYSGRGFSGMKFVARSTSQADFDRWVEEVRQDPDTLDGDAYARLAAPSEKNPIEYYSSVPQDLYAKIIMKFMVPMQEIGDGHDDGEPVMHHN